MIKTIKVCASVLFLSSAVAVASQSALSQFFSATQHFVANFEQRISDEDGTVLDISSGKFYLSRPGKFRWDYDDSDGEQGQQIIADGESIIMFDPDLEQATVRNIENAMGQVPSLLLVHSGVDLKSHFEISEHGTAQGLSWVSLVPKSEDAGYQQLQLGFSSEQLKQIVLLDGLGNKTHLQFTNIISNAAIKQSVFEFTAAPGVDVLRE